MKYKDLTTAELVYIFRGADFRTEPFVHQKQALAFALENPRSALFLDIGLGKTLTALYSTQQLGCERILVVCPNSVVSTWVDETRKHTDRSIVVLAGDRSERLDALRSGAEVSVINYEGLRVLWGKRVESPFKDGGKVQYVPNISAIERADFDAVLIDECHHIANHENLSTSIIHALTDLPPCVHLLTGTPVANSLLDLWSLMFCLDQGQRLGRNYWAYRNKYFRKAGFKWLPKKKSPDAILSKTNELSISFSRDECFDLPPKTYEVREVDMTSEQKRIQAELLAGLKIELANGSVTPANALVVTTKLAQVANGFLIDDNGTAHALKGGNPKADEFRSLMSEMGSKAIVFHRYDYDATAIESVLEKKGLKYAHLRGDYRKDFAAELERFRTDPDCSVMVANARCGGEGVNLQVASVCVFYSIDYSAVSREQAEGRIYRIGQERPCLFVDIVAKGSIDEAIRDAVQGKRDLGEAVLKFIQINS